MTQWTSFRRFIVRATGFPFELVEQLRCSESAELARRIERANRQLDHISQNAPRLRSPSKAVVSALKNRRPVPLEETDSPEAFTEWNKAAGDLEEAQREFSATFDREYTAMLERMKSIACEPRFLEAIASSSPPVYLDIVRGRWSTRVERQIASYVQRFSTKNETMSFFGPINYGQFDEQSAPGFHLTWSGPNKLRARRTHAASWLVQGLVSAIAFDPAVAPQLVLRRKAFAKPALPRPERRLGELLVEQGAVTAAQLERILEKQRSGTGELLGDLVVQAGFCTEKDVYEALRAQASNRRVASNPDSARDLELTATLVSACDGAQTLANLAQQLKTPIATLLPVAKAACARGLLTHQLEIPSSTYLPLNDLLERLSGMPGRAVREHLLGLDLVQGKMSQYSDADAATKVRLLDETRELAETRWGIRSPFAPRPEEKTEKPQERRRSDGQFYADRLPMREECAGDLRLVVGGERVAEFSQRLQGPLDLLALSSHRTREACRQVIGARLGKTRVPFWKVATLFSEDPIPRDGALDTWAREQHTDPNAKFLKLDPRTFPGSPPPEELPLICSVDLLICTRSLEAFNQGEYQILMGDIHDTAQVWGWALQFHQDRLHVETEMVRLIGKAARAMPVVTILASRRTGLLPSEFPGPIIELGGVSSRASPWKLPFDDLSVVSDGVTASLWSNALGTEVALYNGELDTLVQTAFGLPRIRAPKIDFGEYTPRLEVNGVVLQRQSWTVEGSWVEKWAATKDDATRFRAAAQMWDALKLPPVVFAKFAGERKPLLIDPENPLLLRAFASMLEERQKAQLSEMLPAPDQLWLNGPLGRHTCELRCTFVRVAP